MEKFEPEVLFLEAEELYKLNGNITQTSKEKKIDRKKLSRYLRIKGYEFESRQPNPEKYQRAMKDHIDNGTPLRVLREKYQLDRNKLSWLLRQSGVVINSRKLTESEQIEKKRKIEKAEELFLAGATLKKAAKEVIINYYTLCEYLEEEGYDTSYDSRVYSLDESVFERIDMEEKAYWLGFLYADGYNNTDTGKMELTLKKDDINHLIKFQTFLKSNIPIKPKLVLLDGKEYEAVRMIICSKKLTKDLHALGCVDRKSLVLKFPDTKILPVDLTHHFIRGYFDGDGSLFIHDNEISSTISFIGTEDFLRGIQKALNTSPVSLNLKGKAFQFSLNGGKPLIEKLNLLYGNATIYLQRKYEIYQRLITNREERYNKRKESIRKVVSLFKDGKSINQINKETGIFKHLITCWLEYYAGFIPKRNTENEAKKSAEILELLKKGYGLRDIDRMVKTSTYRVKIVALRNGFVDPNDLL